tara:strand:+ start:160 stop:1140 length:981 start_codon:yes stop_codon:yes gene_type:complete
MQKEDKGFSLIEMIICLIIFATLSQIGFVTFRRYSRRAKAFAAETALINVMKECQSNKDLEIEQSFTPIEPKSYFYASKENNCNGNESEGLVYLTPYEENELPTYYYDHQIGEVSCLYNGFINNLFNKCVSKFYKSNFEKNKFVIKDTFIERGCSAYAIVKGDNWNEAEKQANELGGNLVTINDKEEYKWIQKNLVFGHKRLNDANYKLKDPNKLSMYFVGLNDSKEEGKYVWSSGQKSQWKNNEDLIHRQNWLAQRGMANNNDYFVMHSNDVGFSNFVQENYRPDLYNGRVGTLTWVDNNSSYYKGWDSPHFGIVEVDKCSKKNS